MRTPLQFDSQGFTILPQLIRPQIIDGFAASIRAHLENNAIGERHKHLMSGDAYGGWYLPGFAQHENLRHIFESIVDRTPRLKEALQSILGEHRPLSRNEIYVDRFTDWHIDALYNSLASYNKPLRVHSACRFSAHCGGNALLWGRLPNNETQRIATAALYLQDHKEAGNVQALSVRPQSHHGLASPRRNLTEATLHVAKGDLVLFDARLHHRGQTREYANYERRTLAGPHRMVVSITFGRNNAFSEAFERGFALRNALLSNRSVDGVSIACVKLCGMERAKLLHGDLGATLDQPCAYAAAQHDLAERPLQVQY